MCTHVCMCCLCVSMHAHVNAQILQVSSVYPANPLVLASSVKVNILAKDYDAAAKVVTFQLL